MLLFMGVIIWNVERILYYTRADSQSQTQCTAEILTSILNNPYEDATFQICWSESLEISTHPGPNSLKKNSHSRTPNQNLNLLSQRHPSKVFCFSKSKEFIRRNDSQITVNICFLSPVNSLNLRISN